MPDAPRGPSPLARLVVDDFYYRLLGAMPAVAGPIGAIACEASFHCVPAWRRTLLCNAGLALGSGASAWQRYRCARAMMRSMQRFTAEVIASESANAALLREQVCEFDGSQHFLSALARGRGLVLAGIHMGSFEPSLAVLAKHVRRIHVLYQPDPMPRFERARQQLRRRLGVVEHRVEDGIGAWSALHQALLADEVVVLHADRVMPGHRGISMPFLGMPDAQLPHGPVRLAAAAGAPLVPTFCARANGKLRLWAEAAIDAGQQDLRANEVAAHPAQRALVAAMERAIRAYPEQWMAFMDFRGSAA